MTQLKQHQLEHELLSYAGGAGVAIAASNSTFNSGTVQIVGGPNITVGTLANQITLSVAAGGAGSGVAIAANGSSAANGVVSFGNFNNVSFGMNGATITASASYSQSNQVVSAANGSYAFQTLKLANSNGISFSTGTQGIFASHNAMASNASSVFAGINGAITGGSLTLNTNGLSINLPAYLTTAALSNHTHTVIDAIIASAANGTSTFTGSIGFAAGSNVTLSTGPQAISIYANAGGGGGGNLDGGAPSTIYGGVTPVDGGGP